VFGGRFGRLLGIASNGLARLWTTLFAFQFLVVCRPRPGVKQLLLNTQRWVGASVDQAQMGQSLQAARIEESVNE